MPVLSKLAVVPVERAAFPAANSKGLRSAQATPLGMLSELCEGPRALDRLGERRRTGKWVVEPDPEVAIHQEIRVFSASLYELT